VACSWQTYFVVLESHHHGKNQKEKPSMKPELAREVFSLIESEALRRPSPIEFEMAYQGRVAAERIRFAIKAMEARSTAVSLEEASLQLLDALDRLESVDRRFQHRFRCGPKRTTNPMRKSAPVFRPRFGS
jgi:hypothetical protein